MKIKVSEATNPQLDWMVMVSEGWTYEPKSIRPAFFRRLVGTVPQYAKIAVDYTTNWAQGGPIIEREKISLDMLCAPDEWRSALMEGDFYDDQGEWIEGSSHEQTGPTPLIAAMRCFVASKLGDEVEVPDELGGTV